MKVHHFFFFLMLLDDSVGQESADVVVWTGTEGGSITVTCSFFPGGQTRVFCKDDCDQGHVLIRTKRDAAQTGRYRLEYKKGTLLQYDSFSVTITNLRRSDSGGYMCRLDRGLSFLHSDEKIQIIVTHASTTAEPSSSAASTAAATSQGLNPTPFTSTSCQTTSQSEMKTPSTGPPFVLMCVGLILLFLTIILSVVVLVFCRTRASKPKACFPENPKENEVVSQVYEEVRDADRHSRSPPEEDVIIYSLIQHTKPDRDENTDYYSLVTAAQSWAQNRREDESEAAVHRETVVYSVPRGLSEFCESR